MLEGQGRFARVILVLRECVWNVPAVSLSLPAFDDTGSLGYSLLAFFGIDTPTPGSTQGDCLPFPCRE